MPQEDRVLLEVVDRLERLESRVTQTSDVAAQHGDEHTDWGRDPIRAANVAGHTHADPGFPTIAGTASSVENTSSTTSHTVALPPGIRPDEMLLVFFYGNINNTVTWPAGWTEFFSDGGTKMAGVYRKADGTEGTSITVTTASGTDSAHHSYRIADAEDAAKQAPEVAFLGSLNLPLLVPTGGTKNYLWLAVIGSNGTSVTANPTNYINLNVGIGTSILCGSARYTARAASENPGSFTIPGSGALSGATVAIFPKESGGLQGSATIYDVILSGGGDIAAAFAGGAKSVFLLNGAYTLTANVTIPADGYLVGETRDGVVVTAGAYQIVVTRGGLMERLTVKSGTHATVTTIISGTVSGCAFDGNARAARMHTAGLLTRSLFMNFAGGAGDYYVIGVSLAALWAIDSCFFDDAIFGTSGGPAIKCAATTLYCRITNNFILMPDAPTYPSVDLGSAGAVILGMVCSNNIFLDNPSGTPGANGGHIDVGSGVSLLTIAGNTMIDYAAGDDPPFGIRLTGANNATVSQNTIQRTATGIVLRSSRCIVSGNSIAGGTGTTGILLDGDYDNNIISGNVVSGFTTGINISSALADRNIVTQNIAKDNTTPISNSGTVTILRDNVTS